MTPAWRGCRLQAPRISPILRQLFLQALMAGRGSAPIAGPALIFLKISWRAGVPPIRRAQGRALRHALDM
ncbi:hypothetical protein AB4Y32_32960 [Paraburkholderia phymatum]|uniref:Uncharacterized protein n=1 Tax=Paraburkholderia phymatum TaxID=148447 RepID=A0ACC6UA04_9BURK